MVSCPHDDSHRIEPMRDRVYETEATNTWYQCQDCRRMWSLPQAAAVPSRYDNDSSAES
jgi:hypothetical protein